MFLNFGKIFRKPLVLNEVCKNVLFEKLKDIINFRSLFSLKLNLLPDISELTLLQNVLFSSFCIVERNAFDSSVSFQTFFRYYRGIQIFKLFRLQSKSLICGEKKSLKTNLNPLITDLKYSVP